jgi:hypothetical protein
MDDLITFPEHAFLIVEERLGEQQAEGVRMPKGMPLDEWRCGFLWPPRQAVFRVSGVSGRASHLVLEQHPVMGECAATASGKQVTTNLGGFRVVGRPPTGPPEGVY